MATRARGAEGPKAGARVLFRANPCDHCGAGEEDARRRQHRVDGPCADFDYRHLRIFEVDRLANVAVEKTRPVDAGLVPIGER